MRTGRTPISLMLAALPVIGGLSRLAAEDWPQWRGPERNGISAERSWLAGWPEGAAPRVAWRREGEVVCLGTGRD